MKNIAYSYMLLLIWRHIGSKWRVKYEHFNNLTDFKGFRI